jgi:hypothetical protein
MTKRKAPSSVLRSLARAVGSLPPPPKVGRPPSPTLTKPAHPMFARPGLSKPRLVILPHAARFAPAKLVGGLPERRTMPGSVAGRLGTVGAGIAGRIGGFRPGKRR